jgi:hypothetical protein
MLVVAVNQVICIPPGPLGRIVARGDATRRRRGVDGCLPVVWGGAAPSRSGRSGPGAATPCRQMRGSMPDPKELLCLRRELAREVGTTF